MPEPLAAAILGNRFSKSNGDLYTMVSKANKRRTLPDEPLEIISTIDDVLYDGMEGC